MRSMWKGLISFGLVNIPVALYPAVEDMQLHFNQLHKEDGGRIGHKLVCKESARSVARVSKTRRSSAVTNTKKADTSLCPTTTC